MTNAYQAGDVAWVQGMRVTLTEEGAALMNAQREHLRGMVGLIGMRPWATHEQVRAAIKGAK